MKTIALEVSGEFDRRIRIMAAKMDLNRSEFIRQALEERLMHLEGVAENAAVESEVTQDGGVDVAEWAQELEVRQ